MIKIIQKKEGFVYGLCKSYDLLNTIFVITHTHLILKIYFKLGKIKKISYNILKMEGGNMFFAETGGFDFTYIFIAIVLGLLIGMIFSKNKVDKDKYQALDYKEFMDMKRKGTLIDVRKSDLFDENKIVGAKSYPGKSGAKANVRRDIPIFIYDQDGKKASSVSKAYVRGGAVMVYYLKGGFKAYLEEKERKM